MLFCCVCVRAQSAKPAHHTPASLPPTIANIGMQHLITTRICIVAQTPLISSPFAARPIAINARNNNW